MSTNRESITDWECEINELCSQTQREEILLSGADPSSAALFTCFILQDQVKLIRLLERFRGNDYLLVQHLVKFRTDWPT